MCYYNNRYIDSSNCSSGTNNSCTYKPKCPKPEFSPNFATAELSVSPQTLAPLQIATISPINIVGSGIYIENNSNSIQLTRGTYLINYSATLESPVGGNYEIGFVQNGNTIENSTSMLTLPASTQTTVSKSFIFNVADEFLDISLINLSSNSLTLENLVISIIKLGE